MMKKIFLLLAILLCAVSALGQTASNVFVVYVPNDSSTGTVMRRLAKLTGSPSRAVVASALDTSGVVGVVVGGASTLGNAVIQIDGQVICDFDNATVANDYVQVGAGGKCHDAGAAYPSGGQIFGRVLATGAAGPANVLLSASTPGGAPATSGTSILKGSGSGGFSNAVAGTDYESPLTFSSPLSRSTNTISCPTCGLTSSGLNQFASTTSAQLAGVISNETGTGSLVFGTSPNITTPTGIVKGDVGLGNVDNTSDTNKPVSTAQQTALDLKANLASPALTGTPTAPTAAAATNTTQLATTAFVTTADNLKANLAGPTFTGTVTIPSPFTLGSTSVTATGTELNYVAGVTSAIQTQLNTKEATANKDAASGYAGLDASTLLKAAEFPAFTGDATKPAGSLVTTVAKVNGSTPGGTCTNQFVSSISSSAIPTCSTVTLAGAQFANQGTTSTVLHGNAAGNPSFGAVALGTDVSGTLQAANFPALTGDITTSAGALATSLKSTGTAGTYRSATFDAQGRETSGTNPTTFAGYGLSDTSVNFLAAITNETGSGLVVGNDTPTILTPTIASFTNATHNHTNAAGGGQLTISAFSSTTGSGAVVGATSPALVTPTLGVASATSINFGGGALSSYVPSTSCSVALKFGGASTGITYTTQTCNYERVGGQIFLHIHFVLSSKGSSTGAATLTNLPVAAVAGVVQTFATPIYGATYTGTTIGQTDGSATTTISLYALSNGTATALADTNFANTSTVSFVIAYRAN